MYYKKVRETLAAQTCLYDNTFQAKRSFCEHLSEFYNNLNITDFLVGNEKPTTVLRFHNPIVLHRP
jgi:hypothetical protein